MPTVSQSVVADVATRSDGIAAGQGLHLPVGGYSGADYRSAMRFVAPSGWSGWTSITKATLHFYISDHNHVAPKNSSMFCSRMSTGSVWLASPGTQDCESGFSGSNETQYDDIGSISTDRVSWNSGSTANAKKSVVVTGAVRAYWSALVTRLVFVFDNDGSDQYTEIWADEKSGYDAYLEIEYEDRTVPTAPTQTAPAAAAVSVTQTPTLDWTFNGDSPQTNAEVLVYDAAGTTLLYTWPVVGSSTVLVAPVSLTRGSTYQWKVRTQNDVGWGPFSGLRSFSIKALPVVSIVSTRTMEFGAGAPRLRVYWTSDQVQTHYRVQTASPVYDSGWIASTAQNVRLDSVALTSGTAVNVTVSVRTADPLEGSASRSFTPRYGLSTHRKDLTSAPVAWGTPEITATVPTGASVVVEYGSSATATAAPSPLAWYSSLSPVPKARYVFYRVWLIPSATTGPSVEKIVIPTNATTQVADKWGTTKGTSTLVAPWSVAGDEYVYGSRSMAVDVAGAGPYTCWSYPLKVRQGRSYILTGLMKSQGNSGAQFRLENEAGTVLVGGGVVGPVGNIESEKLIADRDWFRPDENDTYRYKTPVWVADADTTVYVALRAGGTSGAKAWFDAIKLEESTVATPWSPGAVGAVISDAGGSQIDGSKGGVWRYRGTAGGARDTVEGGTQGLRFGTDTELHSPSDGALSVDGVPISLSGHTHAAPTPILPNRVMDQTPGTRNWTKPAGLAYIEAEVIGGGGGGGGTATCASGESAGAGGGGGGGTAKRHYLASALPATVSYTVGAAGAAAVAGNNAGGSGGASSFNPGGALTNISGAAGTGGTGSANTTGNTRPAGGNGGAGTGGTVNALGGDGGGGGVVNGIPVLTGVGGGSSLAGITRQVSASNGVTGATPGGGGSGATQGSTGAARVGGAGGVGAVIITEYFA